MITIYKNKEDISPDKEYIELNDVFFNQKTVNKLDERASEIAERIDGAKLLGKYKIESSFNGVTLDVDCLSTGCKTVLNILYYPDKVFCLKECGDNALELLYGMEEGAVYSDYALIPFDMGPVRVCTVRKTDIIQDYDALKEWWENEK
ncbi:MAG: DUF4869 domain-containing protein [Roseburia sp.]|nr:DUF4869 domain-containing protein [Roseburia sp.]MCM1098521.1 DUF4869 domain-containing protein [Ruminococcus flavefaciens]